MANTKLSDLGSRKVGISAGPEVIRTALSDGASIPGDMVGLDASTGQIVPHDEGATSHPDSFLGILDDIPDKAEATAQTADKPVSIIFPTSGRRYRVNVTNPAATVIVGWAIGTSADAGKMAVLATKNAAGADGHITKQMVTGDTVAEVQWN